MKKILFTLLTAVLLFTFVNPNALGAKEKISSTTKEVKPVTVTKVTVKNKPISYPQISTVKNQEARKKINDFLKTKGANAEKAYKAFKKMEAKDKAAWDSKLGEWFGYEYEYTYKVKYNASNKLSIVFYTYTYTGGAHGMTTGQSYNFDVNTGKMVKLSSLLNGKIATVKNYTFNTLTKQYEGGLLIEGSNEIVINDKTTIWVFDKKGVRLIFNPYEVAPYAAGMPEVVIPSSVYSKR